MATSIELQVQGMVSSIMGPFKRQMKSIETEDKDQQAPETGAYKCTLCGREEEFNQGQLFVTHHFCSRACDKKHNWVFYTLNRVKA